jgi:hypothetical protein
LQLISAFGLTSYSWIGHGGSFGLTRALNSVFDMCGQISIGYTTILKKKNRAAWKKVLWQDIVKKKYIQGKLVDF